METRTPYRGQPSASESVSRQSQDWLSFIDACQVAVLNSQLDGVGDSPAVIPALLEAAGRLQTRAGRLLGGVVIFRIANRLNRTLGSGEPVAAADLSEYRHTRASPASGLAAGRKGKRVDVDSRVSAVLDYVRARYLQHDCRLTEIARSLRMSKSHLSRLVLNQTGVTFKGHLQLERMDMAARLLQESNLSIKEIAASTGYEHVPSFDRQFRRYFQVTPGRFRRLTRVRS